MHLIFFILIFFSACNKNTHKDRPTLQINPLASDSFLIRYHLAGMGAMRIKGDETFKFVKGVKKYDEQVPLDENSIFHLGSCTKSMTATLAAILIEEGFFEWSSTLSDLLPDLDIHEGYKSVRFDMLLAHRAGLRRDTEGFEGNSLYNTLDRMEGPEGRLHLANTLLKLSPSYIPDKDFFYSNAGYIIAGLIMEKITGIVWEELMRTKIFYPLQMSSCGFGAIWGHQIQNGLPYPIFGDNPKAFGPAGSVHCNLEDWSKFLKVHLEGFRGESRFLTTTSFEKLHQPYPGSDNTYTFGGWFRVERSWAQGPALTHSGSNTYNMANVWIAPAINSIYMSTINTGGGDTFAASDEMIRSLINF